MFNAPTIFSFCGFFIIQVYFDCVVHIYTFVSGLMGAAVFSLLYHDSIKTLCNTIATYTSHIMKCQNTCAHSSLTYPIHQWLIDVHYYRLTSIKFLGYTTVLFLRINACQRSRKATILSHSVYLPTVPWLLSLPVWHHGCQVKQCCRYGLCVVHFKGSVSF